MGSEFGTWGAAMIAGKAAGLIENLAKHADKCARIIKRPSEPNKKNHQIYKPLIERYIRMQSMLNDFFKEK